MDAAAGRDQDSPNGREILLVDDEAGVRYILRRMLTENGYGVFEAKDGAEALELVRAASERLDLVVSDVAMPRVNGVQLLQTLTVEAPELPCILISGYTAPELARFGITAPCSVLPKPLTEEVFLKEVRRCLRERN
jgi:two-component system, NtrC family, response regulator HydG